MAGCGSTTLYHKSLPALHPITHKEVISAARHPKHNEIRIGDLDIYARVPTLYYILKRTFVLDNENFPDIPVFSGPPFGIDFGFKSNTKITQLDPYKIGLEIPGKKTIFPDKVFRVPPSKWSTGCSSIFNPVTKQWDSKLPVEKKGEILSIYPGLDKDSNIQEYQCFTILYSVETPDPNQTFSLRFGDARIPSVSDQIIYFVPTIVEYGQPLLH